MEATKDVMTPSVEGAIVTQGNSASTNLVEHDEEEEEEEYESFVHVENLANQGANASEINKLSTSVSHTFYSCSSSSIVTSFLLFFEI